MTQSVWLQTTTLVLKSAHFDLTGASCKTAQPIYQIWNLSPAVTKIWKEIQNVEMGWFVADRSRSLEMAPFDRAHMSSY